MRGTFPARSITSLFGCDEVVSVLCFRYDPYVKGYGASKVCLSRAAKAGK